MRAKFTLLIFTIPLFLLLKVNGQTFIQCWDFNEAHPASGTGTDSCGTAFGYDLSLASEFLKDAWPLKPAYSKVNGAKMVCYRSKKGYQPLQRDITLEALGPGGAMIFLSKYCTAKNNQAAIILKY